MYHAMKHALRARMGRGVHELMDKGEDRESLGLAPDESHDLAHGMHGAPMHNNMSVADHLMHAADKNMNPEEIETEESEQDLSLSLANQAHDSQGPTMPHSGKVETSHDEVHLAHMGSKKPKTIKEAAMLHAKSKGKY